MENSRIIRPLQLPGVVTILLLAIILVACESASEPEPDPCSEPGVYLRDDFDGTNDCGWVMYSGRGVEEVIEDGAFRIETSQPGYIGWTLADLKLDDVVITTQSRQLEGPDDNAYGVICRYQSEDNYYVFLISGDGFYAIGKFQSGSDEIQYLTGDGGYAPTDAINQGPAVNQIEASCVGNELSLSINGLFVDSVDDPTFVIGDVGLGAGTFQPGTVVVEFDNFRAAAP
jgi:hypothetical protein